MAAWLWMKEVRKSVQSHEAFVVWQTALWVVMTWSACLMWLLGLIFLCLFPSLLEIILQDSMYTKEKVHSKMKSMSTQTNVTLLLK